METLGNEALGRMMNIVDEAEPLVELESWKEGQRPQTSILNILNNTGVGTTCQTGHLVHHDVILTPGVICPHRSGTLLRSTDAEF